MEGASDTEVEDTQSRGATAATEPELPDALLAAV